MARRLTIATIVKWLPYGRKAVVKTDTQTTISGSAQLIDQRKLEAFVDQRYHWKSLSPTDQTKMARELYQLRAFLYSYRSQDSHEN
jgi:hypothetical protein